MAFTSRWSTKFGCETISANRRASSHVLTKSVSAAESGSMQSVTPMSAIRGIAERNTSEASANACSVVTPANKDL